MSYYTPEIEDLHVGYEFQFAPSNSEDNYNWKDGVIQAPGANQYLLERLEKGRMRTPYLTKEQIEKEGWEVTIGHWTSFKKNRYFGIWLGDKICINLNDVLDDNFTEATSNGRLYYGKCPSINEFRKICKLLGI